MDKYKQSYFNIIAILIMLVGIVLFWLKVDATGKLLSVGFFCMGIYAFIETLKA
ncbi:MAG: hypothetical protein HC859_07150, partial [Bacteroidia bacterium]|nr:hypothetical protein [Bacteroidia bacterium]